MPNSDTGGPPRCCCSPAPDTVLLIFLVVGNGGGGIPLWAVTVAGDGAGRWVIRGILVGVVEGKFLGELEYLAPSGGRAGEPIIAGKRSNVLLPLMVVASLLLETAEPRVPKELSAEDWCLRPGNGFGRSPDMESVCNSVSHHHPLFSISLRKSKNANPHLSTFPASPPRRRARARRTCRLDLFLSLCRNLGLTRLLRQTAF